MSPNSGFSLKLKRKWMIRNTGRHLGIKAGFGMAPGGIRPYESSDPTKLIDWRASARLGEYVVRDRQVEFSARTLIIVDYSHRQVWGGGDSLLAKSELNLATTEAMSDYLVRGEDRVGVVVLGEKTEHSPIARGAESLRSIGRALDRAVPSTDDRLGAFLGQTRLNRYGNAQVVIVISDLLSSGWEGPLAKLARKYEVIALQTSDPWDRKMPDIGLNVASGARLGTHRANVRAEYDAIAADQQAHIRQTLVSARVLHLQASTKSPTELNRAS